MWFPFTSMNSASASMADTGGCLRINSENEGYKASVSSAQTQQAYASSHDFSHMPAHMQNYYSAFYVYNNNNTNDLANNTNIASNSTSVGALGGYMHTSNVTTAQNMLNYESYYKQKNANIQHIGNTNNNSANNSMNNTVCAQNFMQNMNQLYQIPSPPADHNLANLIDQTAKALSVCTSENFEIVRNLYANNQQYSFIFGGEGYAYFNFLLQKYIKNQEINNSNQKTSEKNKKQNENENENLCEREYDIDSLLLQYKEPPPPPLLSEELQIELHEVLENLDGECTYDKIRAGRTWFELNANNPDRTKELVYAIKTYLTNKIDTTSFTFFINALYFIHDILLNEAINNTKTSASSPTSRAKREYVNEFKPYLISILKVVYKSALKQFDELGDESASINKMMNILSLWVEKGILDEDEKDEILLLIKHEITSEKANQESASQSKVNNNNNNEKNINGLKEESKAGGDEVGIDDSHQTKRRSRFDQKPNSLTSNLNQSSTNNNFFFFPQGEGMIGVSGCSLPIASMHDKHMQQNMFLGGVMMNTASPVSSYMPKNFSQIQQISPQNFAATLTNMANNTNAFNAASHTHFPRPNFANPNLYGWHNPLSMSPAHPGDNCKVMNAFSASSSSISAVTPSTSAANYSSASPVPPPPSPTPLPPPAVQTPETIPVGLMATLLKALSKRGKNMQIAFVPYRPIDPLVTPQHLPPMESPSEYLLDRVSDFYDDYQHELRRERRRQQRKREDKKKERRKLKEKEKEEKNLIASNNSEKTKEKSKKKKEKKENKKKKRDVSNSKVDKNVNEKSILNNSDESSEATIKSYDLNGKDEKDKKTTRGRKKEKQKEKRNGSYSSSSSYRTASSVSFSSFSSASSRCSSSSLSSHTSRTSSRRQSASDSHRSPFSSKRSRSSSRKKKHRSRSQSFDYKYSIERSVKYRESASSSSATSYEKKQTNWINEEMGVMDDGSVMRNSGLKGERLGLGMLPSASEKNQDVFESFRRQRANKYHENIAQNQASRREPCSENKLICYICQQPGHFARDCKYGVS